MVPSEIPSSHYQYWLDRSRLGCNTLRSPLPNSRSSSGRNVRSVYYLKSPNDKAIFPLPYPKSLSRRNV